MRVDAYSVCYEASREGFRGHCFVLLAFTPREFENALPDSDAQCHCRTFQSRFREEDEAARLIRHR